MQVLRRKLWSFRVPILTLEQTELRTQLVTLPTKMVSDRRACTFPATLEFNPMRTKITEIVIGICLCNVYKDVNKYS